MLQQTQVERVLPIYERFLDRWSTFEALALAEPGDVVRAWRGLGYNSRAIRLRELAATVVREHGGTLPRERDALLRLPGIGPYTASAIRAFAFDCDDVAPDTNVRRIVHRVELGVEHPERASPLELDRRAAHFVPPGHGHDANSALMDLGSSICTARAPRCLICPLATLCAAAPIDAASLASRARDAARPRAPQNRIRFEDSRRFLRGRIVDRLRDLEAGEVLSVADLRSALAGSVPDHRLDEIPAIVERLVADGLLSGAGNGLRLA